MQDITWGEDMGMGTTVSEEHKVKKGEMGEEANTRMMSVLVAMATVNFKRRKWSWLGMYANTKITTQNDEGIKDVPCTWQCTNHGTRAHDNIQLQYLGSKKYKFALEMLASFLWHCCMLLQNGCSSKG